MSSSAKRPRTILNYKVKMNREIELMKYCKPAVGSVRQCVSSNANRLGRRGHLALNHNLHMSREYGLQMAVSNNRLHDLITLVSLKNRHQIQCNKGNSKLLKTYTS